MIDRTVEGWRVQWVLEKARVEGSAADCIRRKVGAVIYDPRSFHTLAEGYNGRPAGLPGCLTEGACPRGQMTYEQVGARTPYLAGGAGACDAVHAEDNSLRRARERGIDVTGAHIAVTDEPCPGCYALLRHYAIAHVVWPGGSLQLVA